MAQVLVTGCNGFVGKHLIRELVSKGTTVFGLGFEEPAHPEISGLLKDYFQTDLTSSREVAALKLKNIDAVINLAGLAKIGDSFAQPEFYKKVNVEVLTNLGNELVRQNKHARIIAISTGAVYDSKQSMPLTEDSKTVEGVSPYADSKLIMETEAEKLRKLGLDCIVVRPFNHIGPGQEGGFLLPDLLAKIQNAQKTGNVIKVGNLKTKRDYTDVRDIVRGYTMLALAKNLPHQLYNICSGTSHSGEEILQTILNAMNKQDIRVEIDQDLIRPNDPADLFGSNALLAGDTGWQPKIPLEKTIEDFVKSKY